MQPVFEYRHSTKTEGYAALIGLLATMIGLVWGIWFFRGHRVESSPVNSIFDGVALVFVIVGCVAFIFGYAIPNIRLNTYFSVRIFEDRIECESPHPNFGPSFALKLEEISHFECDNDGDWVIVSVSGEVFGVTPNYGNPQPQVLNTLHSLRPDLETKHVKKLSVNQPKKVT
jgi:hypothetical protein